MADWLSSMQQTYEYYTVDPATWGDVKRLDTIKSCTIDRDSEADTLGSASIEANEILGESYIRVYLVTIQNGVEERHPLGTFLVQTPSSAFDGKTRSVTMDAYTPLIELKEKMPEMGYAIVHRVEQKPNIMDEAYKIVRANVRAPVVQPTCDKVLHKHFVSDSNENWLTFTRDLIQNADYTFDLDEISRILFAPKREIDAMQPVWTFTDDENSIMYPDINMRHDLYDIPNVVEVVYSNGEYTITKIVKNEDPNSPTSIQRRGREIKRRVTDPGFVADFGTQGMAEIEVENYAKKLLKELSTVEYEISYTHGYCPVRVGDCVRINYEKAGLMDIKAKVISQSIRCVNGCSVSEKAVFTTKLWG